MSFKCYECGHIFEEFKKIDTDEKIVFGEFQGKPIYDDGGDDYDFCCPKCGGEYEETRKCAICGEEYLEDELVDGVCEECISEYKYDIEMCYTIGAYETENIELNSFLAAMYTKEDIEAILYKDLLEYQKENRYVDCESFINYDKSWFAERLAEEVKK